MKKNTLLLVTIVSILANIAFVSLLLRSFYTPEVQAMSTPVPALSTAQQAWLGSLEWCESHGRESAINPKDSDGTPSYGLLQFKPSTYALFAKQFHLASTTDYMNPDGQVAIVTGLLLKGKVNWHQQFPDCVRKIGMPPLSTQ